jgi:hypothetical protein
MSSGCPSSNGQWCHRETSVAWKIFMFNRRMSPSHQHVICSICFIWFYFFNGQLNRILFVQGDDDQSIGMYIPFYTYIIWLVAWNMFFIFHILGMSSSQLMNSIIFQRGSIHQPVVINDISILFWGLPSSSFFQFKSMSSSTYFPKKNHGFTVLHHIPDIFQNFPVINPWNPW